MNYLNWIKYWFLFLLIVPLNYALNYIVDPFNIFHSKFFPYQLLENERFLKIEYLEENYQKYNAYMFGSSRIGTTSPSTIEKYIPNTKFYNFSLSSANTYDYLIHLAYFIKKRYPINYLYLQIDLEDISKYSRDNSNPLFRTHPYVVGNSLNTFYLSYLSGFFPLSIRGKIEMNLQHRNYTHFNIQTGEWFRPDKEKLLKTNCQKYVAKEPTFHNNNLRTIGVSNLKKTTNALKKIKQLCDTHNIKLYLFITPHNQNMMDRFKIDDYLTFLKNLVKITNFYNFSGYNTITTNNCNYYEESHYRPFVGELIAARIFGDTSVQIPSDFGYFVTPKNINKHLQQLKKQLIQRDLQRGIKISE